jgi:hypothetical protein
VTGTPDPIRDPSEGRDPVADFVTVPAGTYRCRIDDVRTGTTRGGDERWSLRLTVVDGPFAGRMAAWDAVVFSTRGRMRARLVLAAMGLPAAGRVTVEPKDLLGRTAMVEVRPAEYLAPDGARVLRNEVPFDGWRRLDAAGGGDLARELRP